MKTNAMLLLVGGTLCVLVTGCGHHHYTNQNALVVPKQAQWHHEHMPSAVYARTQEDGTCPISGECSSEVRGPNLFSIARDQCGYPVTYRVQPATSVLVVPALKQPDIILRD